MKVCVRCNQEKPLSMFAKGKLFKDGVRGTCKRCHTDYMNEYYTNNPEKRVKKNQMNSKHKPNWKSHGLTEQEFNRLYSLRDGRCHSCNLREAVAIDHDHLCCAKKFSCGKCVRGLLCSQCNTALGLLADSKEYIMLLAKYVGNHK